MVWIQTYTGKRFELLAPTAEMVCAQDIAHALSQLCRYTGHTTAHCSVAEHCCHVAAFLATEGHDAETVLWGLLHDAAEAYVGDVSAPLKMSIRPAAGGPSKFDIIEERVADAVALHFGVTRTEQMEARVNDADMRLLATEARQVFPRGMRPDWGIDHIEPVPNGVIGCWPAMRAETRWLETLFRLARDTGRTDLAREGIRLNPRS